ncbi:MAG: hypothetical protein K9K67_13395 [Bacteriovoracaceae bacterium]|nr:hypothetical protein [Bacteriovoracaceae bacterium]
MDVKYFFNIVLLALSLTTIFITLISYIIFKLRQGSFIKLDNEYHKIEGAYFRRYAPELEKINEERLFELKKKENNPKKFYYKIIFLFSFVFLLVLTVFLVEDFYSRRVKFQNDNQEITLPKKNEQNP